MGSDDERNSASIAFFLQRWAGPPGPDTVFFQCRFDALVSSPFFPPVIGRSTEMLFYHSGSPLVIHTLAEDGSSLTRRELGLDLARGQLPGIAVTAGTWFTRLVEIGDPAHAYCLFRYKQKTVNLLSE